MKPKPYKYRLTPVNRQLADFFQGCVIDEENSILWSDQNLNCLCGEIWERNQFLMICIGIPLVIEFWAWMGLLAAGKLFPSTKKFAWDAEQRINIAIMSRLYW